MHQPAHSHGKPHTHAAHPRNGLLWAVGLTLGFAGVEAAAGWWAGSLALMGDAGHMVTDSTALGVAALAAWFTRRPASHRHSYGLGRAEVIAALGNCLLMLGVVGGIAVEAVGRLESPRAVAGTTVAVVAFVGLALNLGVAFLLHRQGTENLNVRGALLHVLGDVAGSVAALISGLVIRFTGWTPIDPILSLFISLLILYSSLRLLREALHIIMEGVPLHLDLPEIGHAMARTNGVRSVHDLHIWTLSSGLVALSAHVEVDNLARWGAVLDDLQRTLDEGYGVHHVTLQPEPVGGVRGRGAVASVPIQEIGRSNDSNG